MNPIKVAVIGLDTSHSVEFPKLMQDPSIPEEKQIRKLRTTKCLRFETPFQNKNGLDQRQAYLESIGVSVTEDFSEAVSDCDAILIEINDPACHLEYFAKCAGLGKPIFLDKPFADTFSNAMEILRIAQTNSTRFFTASPLRFDIDLNEGLATIGDTPFSATVHGPLGHAPSGSSIVWYGVHAFEMLQRIMGRGALTVQTCRDPKGCVCHVSYEDGRRGIVELTSGCYRYGCVIRTGKGETLIPVTGRISFYESLLESIERFFKGEQIVEHEDSIEVMSMLEAADRSSRSDNKEAVYRKQI